VNLVGSGFVAHAQPHHARVVLHPLHAIPFDVVSTLAEGRLSGMTLVWQLVAWTPLSALVTAAVGLVVLAAVRPATAERRFR
jgi:hypothetical protein